MITNKNKKKYLINSTPLVAIEYEDLEKKGIKKNDLYDYFPEYVLNPTPLKLGKYKKFHLTLLKSLMRIGIRLILNPRRGKVGSLNKKEVEKVYNKEAKTYYRKHHFTTRFKDDRWRDTVGMYVVSRIRNLQNKKKSKVLDLCTGTGLTALAIHNCLNVWNLNDKAEIVGLDYNNEMLKIAQNNLEKTSITLVRGDATNLTDNTDPNFSYYPHNSFDVVTQMCGIGGIISNSLSVFSEVLKVLKPGGVYYMSDAHAPVPEYAADIPIFFKPVKFPVLESYVYNEIAIPLVFKRLWGWDDPTKCFYLVPLIAYYDGKKYWGFKKPEFEYESHIWWCNLTVLPYGVLKIEKEEISKEEFVKRELIISAVI